jgi:L-lactate dehydrogenase complex protein LldG
MTSRDTILHTVRTECAKQPHLTAPEVPVVWPLEHPAPGAMAERFAKELVDVQGEVVRCASMADAKRELASLVQQNGWNSLGLLDRPIVHEVTADLKADSLHWGVSDLQPRTIAEYSASVIAAEVLLADTGTCMIECRIQPERLLCYLPPACVIVAKVDQLAEHLQAAWPQIAPRIAEPDRRGEFVFVTGPSRTADIEKILILGVHGPKRLIVLLVG